MAASTPLARLYSRVPARRHMKKGEVVNRQDPFRIDVYVGIYARVCEWICVCVSARATKIFIVDEVWKEDVLRGLGLAVRRR